MNYIHRLQQENEQLRNAARAAQEATSDLREYVNSAKFRSGDALDNYVNVQDVILRLAPISEALNSL